MPDDQIVLANAPEIAGLYFRLFCGERDYGSIAKVLTASDRADQIERNVTAEDIAAVFKRGLQNCNPYTDMIFAEVAGEVVGYARGWWTDELPNMRLYMHSGFLMPAWRRKGIGQVLLSWMEAHLKEVAARHPPELEKHLQVNVSQYQEGAAILLEKVGYQPVRYFFEMVRPNLDDIPDIPLPAGLEIRKAIPDHYRAIWQSMHESPQEEWGATQPTEEAYQEWQTHPHFQPERWQIAWDKAANSPVGHVLTYISHEENEQFSRKRGYTEGIGVSQEWRRRGVARSLISLSLQAQKAAGMSESALIADSDSKFDVASFYESCGFQIVNRDAIYRKPI